MSMTTIPTHMPETDRLQVEVYPAVDTTPAWVCIRAAEVNARTHVHVGLQPLLDALGAASPADLNALVAERGRARRAAEATANALADAERDLEQARQEAAEQRARADRYRDERDAELEAKRFATSRAEDAEAALARTREAMDFLQEAYAAAQTDRADAEAAEAARQRVYDQFEGRDVIPAAVPYTGGLVDDDGVPLLSSIGVERLAMRDRGGVLVAYAERDPHDGEWVVSQGANERLDEPYRVLRLDGHGMDVVTEVLVAMAEQVVMRRAARQAVLDADVAAFSALQASVQKVTPNEG